MVTVAVQLWTFIDYFHPDTEKKISWDRAFKNFYSKIVLGLTNQQFAGLLKQMLEYLEDPGTCLWQSTSKRSYSCLRTSSPTAEYIRDDVVLLRYNAPEKFENRIEAAIDELDSVIQILAPAEKVIIDLRCSTRSGGKVLKEVYEASKQPGALVSKPTVSPAWSIRFYKGGYKRLRKRYEGKTVEPLPHSASKRVVFLVNENSELPDVAIAMQMNGDGYVIADGTLPGRVGNHTAEILIDGLGLVEIRLSELVDELNSSWGPFRANRTVESADNNDAALEVALNAFGEGWSKVFYEKRPRRSFKQLATTMQFPEKDYRVLAAARIWFVFNFFFPYKHLIEVDWDRILLDYINAFERSQDALSYALTVKRMVAHAGDSHCFTTSTLLWNYFGTADPPFDCRFIEGRPVITQLYGQEARNQLHIGDVIVSLNGDKIGERLKQLEPFVAASTIQARDSTLMDLVFKGENGTTFSMRVSDGIRETEVELQRNLRTEAQSYFALSECVEVLEGNIGYADLGKLHRDQVDAMFKLLATTDCIIFDMRGYPNGTAWGIAPRLISDEKIASLNDDEQQLGVPSAIFKCPCEPVLSKEFDSEQYVFVQRTGVSKKRKYLKPTVLLIDERTMSQAEHTGLFLRSANGTKFVGTPTLGADGDVTSFKIPGGIEICYSGMLVEHVDGTQLQRVGLIPDVYVAPTIAGIRSGRDEVLERAVEVAHSMTAIAPQISCVPTEFSSAGLIGTVPTGSYRPGTWQLSNHAHYQLDSDPLESRAGGVPFCLKSQKDDRTIYGAVTKVCSAEEYLGKRVRMHGWMKTVVSDSSFARFYICVLGNWRVSDGMDDNMRIRQVYGTTEWTKYDLVVDVPKTSTNITFGAILMGGGMIWIDDLKLEIVDKRFALVGLDSRKNSNN